MAADDKHPQRSVVKELTLPDLARRFSDDGAMLTVVNSLSQRNRFIEDMRYKEAMTETQEYFGFETSLPTGQWLSPGQGVISERSDQDTMVEDIGSLRALSRLNYDVVRLSAGSLDAIRTQEDMRFIKGLSHTITQTVLYGNMAVNPKQFTGLAPRYNSKAWKTTFSGGGSGSDLMSVWIVNWNIDDGAYIFYPKGSQNLGINIIPLPMSHATDTENGGEYIAYRTFFNIEWGMAIKRRDNVVRYGDIETSGSTNTWDYRTMIRALNQLWEPTGAVIYGNREGLTQMDLIAVDKANVEYRSSEVYGHVTKNFQGHEAKLVEQLLEAESALAA